MAELEVANTAGRKEETVTNIKVAVRCRPMSSTEKAKGEQSCFRIENGTACLQNPTNPSEIHRFGFDLLYDGDSEQVDIWRDVGVPALEKAFAGFNTTVFAYGQTGSGKTFSMQGDASVGGGGEQAGVIPRMNRELFARIAREKAADPNKMFLATCAYFEIYNEVIYDLLDPNNRKSKGSGLEIREHSVLGIYVKGLQEMVVTSPENTQKLIDQGMLSRTVGSTAMNDTSSRSHSVLTVKIHQKDASDGSKSTFAKINLVDLAGSERAKSTGAKGARLKEGANINKSLSSLGNVINALVEVANGKKGVFVPYRNSKLTRVLQESLGGNSLTAMLAALSPAACNFDETLSTLKYASRAKSIKVNAVKNEEASQVSRLEEEIRSLKQKLAERASQASVPAGLREGREGQGATPCETGARVGSPSGANAAAISFGDGGGPDGTSREDRYKQQIAEMEAAMKSTWEEKASQSQAMERERLRLQRKLEEEARREERERKKRWRALEDKGDLELSIRETRDAALPTLPAKDWLRRTRALAEAENRKREESTVCGVYREALVREVEAAFDHDGPGEEAGWVPRGRGLPSAHSYDAAMLRQLQARISSLRGARERLYGPLTEAVEEASRDLLESVEAFSKTLAASPRAGHPEKEVLEGGCRGGSSVGGDVGAGLRAGADATGKGRRWEARRREGTRALLMIRRQIMERGRRRRQQRRRQSGDSLPRDRVNEDISFLPGGERAAEGASARADGEKGPEDEPEDDIEALIQAAALLERAIEAILPDDRRSAFAYAARDGREKASAPDDSAPCGLDMVREGENCVDGDGDGDGEGGGDLSDTDDDDMMPSELDEAPYRTVLTTLNEALLCLRSSISSARLEAELETAIDSLSTPAAGVEDAAALGPHTTGIVDGRPDSGDATSSSGDLSPGRFSGEKSRSMEEGILPDASRWGFRVSPGGWARAEGGGFESAGSADVDERKRKREGEESEDVLTSREKRQCASFRWNTGLESRTAPASLESERTMEVDGRKIREGDTCWVKLDFPEDAAVSSVTVQILDGQGRAKQDDNPIGSLGSAVEAPVPLALSSCGLKDVDGSIERTEALLGAVLGGWGSILKSTPPSKLLTRPPVRFLYDLFRAVARETGFGTEVISSDSTWEELTGKREKLQLMDSMVRHVSDTLGLKAPPARGSDIIVGKECSATNRFLQLLALAAHDHRQRATQRVGSGDDNGNGDGDGDGEVDDCSVNDGTPGGCSAWTRRLRVEVSRDGDTWEALLVAEASEERTRERFATWRTSTSTATRCRSMRLTVPALGENRSGEPPDRGADDGHGECSRSPREARPALIRVGVEGLRDGAGESKRRRQRRRRHTRGDRGDRGDPEAVDSSQGHQARAGALLDAMDVAVRCLLDQALEWRRIASANRERRMAFRTNQMESLEKSLKAAEEGNMRLAKERKVLMEKAARIEGEKLDLKEEVLRLTADIGRERVENTSITEKLAQAELRLDEDKAQLSELEALKIALHGEADDLQNQVEVLIEERDIARSNEEELFARLMEKNEDLEALQESYVSLTDRWNDFQDEHDELQEQVDRLRHTLRLTTATTPEAADASHNGGERPETYHVEQRRLDEQESHGTSQDEWERGQGCTGTLQALKPSVNRSTNDDDSPAGSGKRESHLLQGFQGDTPQPSKPGSRQDGPDLPCDESHQAGRVTLAEKVPMPAASNDPRGANDCGGASAPTAGTTLPLNKSETVGLPMESGHYEDDFHDFSDSDEGNHRHVQQSRATVDTEHKQVKYSLQTFSS